MWGNKASILLGYEDSDIERLEYAVDEVMLFKKLLELEINESSTAYSSFSISLSS